MVDHGRYKIELTQQVITVHFYGTWNVETSRNMCRDFFKSAYKICAEPWACLVNLSQWELGGPDVWEPIIEVNHWCAKNNQMHEAVVCNYSIQKYILQELQTYLPNTESNFFNNVEAAVNWLQNNGYK